MSCIENDNQYAVRFLDGWPVTQIVREQRRYSQTIRAMLYDWYDYVPKNNEQLDDAYREEKTSINPGCWVLPVEKGFSDVLLRAVSSRPEKLLISKYRMALSEPF